MTRWKKTILVTAAGLSMLEVWGVLGAVFDYNMLRLPAALPESERRDRRARAPPEG